MHDGGRRRRLALAVLCLCALVAGIDMTVTNVALPFIGRDFDAPVSELQWTVDSYNIVLAGFLVLGGALADRHGRKFVFLSSFLVFAAGSALAAFSPQVGVLVGARALMGIGAAGFTAPALAIIASMYPPEERSGAIGAFVVFGASGLAIGPVAGGLLLDRFWWGSVFLVNVPVILAGVALGLRAIPESRAPEPASGWGRLDVLGAVMSVVALGALLFGVIEAPRRGWDSPLVIGGLVLGVVVLHLFVRRELAEASPLFDVRILLRPAVVSGSVTLFMAYLLFNTFLFITPQYLQDVSGESIVAVGLLFAPFAIAFGGFSLRAQNVLGALGAAATIPLGLLVGALGSALLAISLSGPVWQVVASSIVFAAGMSLLIAPPSTVVMNDLPPSKAGDGSSLNFVSRFVGAAVGVAIVGSILASVYAADLGDATAPLDTAQTQQAEGSIQGALEVSRTLAPGNASALADGARDAFDSAARAGLFTAAALAVVAAVVARAALRRDREPST
ncbi:MAG: MFS transporter [Microthrixaceae bacterium]